MNETFLETELESRAYRIEYIRMIELLKDLEGVN